MIFRSQVKLRTKQATEIFQKQFPYKGKVGSIETVLVTELATDGEHYVGHNKFYEQVLVPKDESYMGSTLTGLFVRLFVCFGGST